MNYIILNNALEFIKRKEEVDDRTKEIIEKEGLQSDRIRCKDLVSCDCKCNRCVFNDITYTYKSMYNSGGYNIVKEIWSKQSLDITDPKFISYKNMIETNRKKLMHIIDQMGYNDVICIRLLNPKVDQVKSSYRLLRRVVITRIGSLFVVIPKGWNEYWVFDGSTYGDPTPLGTTYRIEQLVDLMKIKYRRWLDNITSIHGRELNINSLIKNVGSDEELGIM